MPKKCLAVAPEDGLDTRLACLAVSRNVTPDPYQLLAVYITFLVLP